MPAHLPEAVRLANDRPAVIGIQVDNPVIPAEGPEKGHLQFGIRPLFAGQPGLKQRAAGQQQNQDETSVNFHGLYYVSTPAGKDGTITAPAFSFIQMF